jgi:uncharacterized protein (TIGR02594 family)
MTKDPAWLASARKYIGQKEVAGGGSSKWILSLWETVPWIWSTVACKDDTLLAWCGAFIRLVMVENGVTPPKKWWSAASWADWGIPLKSPAYGCIAVMKRKGGAHVTIIVGINHAGKLVGLGGNQGDAVKLSAFEPSLFSAYVWPPNQAFKLKPLPNLFATMSESES